MAQVERSNIVSHFLFLYIISRATMMARATMLQYSNYKNLDKLWIIEGGKLAEENESKKLSHKLLLLFLL